MMTSGTCTAQHHVKKIIMVHLRFTTLLIGLLLILLTVVLAHKDVTMTNNDQALESVKVLRTKQELGDQTTKVVAMSKSGRRLNGRKLGVATEMKNKGKYMNLLSKSYGTPDAEDSAAIEPANLSNTYGKSQVNDESLESQDQKLIDETADIFKMMNKDYHQRARRRPPINNHLPLEDRKNDLAP